MILRSQIKPKIRNIYRVSRTKNQIKLEGEGVSLAGHDPDFVSAKILVLRVSQATVIMISSLLRDSSHGFDAVSVHNDLNI